MSNQPSISSGEPPTVTIGAYQTELDSARVFDEAIEKSGLFKIWKEVIGENIQPIPGMSNKECYRIDRILVATDKLQKSGWTKGLIGVELKRTGIKVGPPLSQMLDYLRCAWGGPDGVKVLLGYCFLWPLDKCGGCVASIMAQNHIGGACLSYPAESEWHRLQFSIGEQFVIVHYLNTDRTEVKNLCIGNKMGSR